MQQMRLYEILHNIRDTLYHSDGIHNCNIQTGDDCTDTEERDGWLTNVFLNDAVSTAEVIWC